MSANKSNKWVKSKQFNISQSPQGCFTAWEYGLGPALQLEGDLQCSEAPVVTKSMWLLAAALIRAAARVSQSILRDTPHCQSAVPMDGLQSLQMVLERPE